MTDLKPPPLPYEQAGPAGPPLPREPAWKVHISVLVVSLCGWALVAIVLAVAGLRLGTLFQDFKTELPRFTKVVLGVSRWWIYDFGIVFTFPLAWLPFLVSYLFDLTASDEAQAKRQALWIGRIAFWLALILVVVLVLSLLLPMLSLLSSISGSAKK